MARGDVPGEFEQVVLLALAAFDGEARGRQVYESVLAATSRDVSVAAIHITLTRLDEKGWAICRTSALEPGQGGKPRKHYALSKAGASILRELRRQSDLLWEGALAHSLLKGAGR